MYTFTSVGPIHTNELLFVDLMFLWNSSLGQIFSACLITNSITISVINSTANPKSVFPELSTGPFSRSTRLSHHSPDSQITPWVPTSPPRFSNHSPSSQVSPCAIKSIPGLSNHSMDSQINPQALKSLHRLSNHSPGSAVLKSIQGLSNRAPNYESVC